jgi:hypothetical protein
MTTTFRVPRGLASLLLIALSAPAVAVSPETANSLVALAERVRTPAANASDFEKWTFDTFNMAAVSCWRAAHPKTPLAPSHILNRPFARSGSNTLMPSDALERMCTSLATKGLQPWCSHGTLWGDRKQPDGSLPRDYLQFDRYPGQPVVQGSLYCHLTEDQIHAQPFVPDRFVATWAMPPEVRSFMTSGGARNIKAGTVMVEVPTAPGQTVVGRPQRAFAFPYTAVLP